MALSVHEIHIIATNYSQQFDAEELEVDLEQIVEQYRREHFQIYKKYANLKDWLVDDKLLKFTCEVPRKKEHS